jgi:hypothetical protein
MNQQLPANQRVILGVLTGLIFAAAMALAILNALGDLPIRR